MIEWGAYLSYGPRWVVTNLSPSPVQRPFVSYLTGHCSQRNSLYPWHALSVEGHVSPSWWVRYQFCHAHALPPCWMGGCPLQNFSTHCWTYVFVWPQSPATIWQTANLSFPGSGTSTHQEMWIACHKDVCRMYRSVVFVFYVTAL